MHHFIARPQANDEQPIDDANPGRYRPIRRPVYFDIHFNFGKGNHLINGHHNGDDGNDDNDDANNDHNDDEANDGANDGANDDANDGANDGANDEDAK